MNRDWSEWLMTPRWQPDSFKSALAVIAPVNGSLGEAARRVLRHASDYFPRLGLTGENNVRDTDNRIQQN